MLLWFSFSSFLKKERKKALGWIGGKVEGIWKGTIEGNYDQNILYENILFSIKRKKVFFSSFVHFNIRLFVSLFLECLSFLYILHILHSHFLNACFENIFFCFIDCHSTQLLCFYNHVEVETFT